jgi:hypothetical protein
MRQSVGTDGCGPRFTLDVSDAEQPHGGLRFAKARAEKPSVHAAHPV